MVKTILALSLTALALTGCATKQDTAPADPMGGKIAYFKADIPYDETLSRCVNIARAFGANYNDADPEKLKLTNTQSRLLGNAIQGVSRYGSAGIFYGFIPTAIDAMEKTYRGEVDEWNAIVPTDGYERISDALYDTVMTSTDLTENGLRKLGFKTEKSFNLRDKKTGELVFYMENYIKVVDEKRGCEDRGDATDGCYVLIRTNSEGFGSREKAPTWLHPLGEEQFVFRSIVVLAKGQRSTGEKFQLTREERMSLGKESGNHFYFLGAFDLRNPIFIGENGEIHEGYMLPEQLAKVREKEERGIVHNVLEAHSNKLKEDWKKRGPLMIFDSLWKQR